MYNITIFSKHTPVTDVLLLAKLASTRIASRADLTLGFCKISALTCCRGISRTKPALCCLKTFSHLAVITNRFSQGFHSFPRERESMYSFSPAARGTKKLVYLPYRGAIPFWFYLVPLRLVSMFLNVGHVEISCGFLPTCFLSILL